MSLQKSKVWIGTRSPGTRPTWDSGQAEPLYIDRVRHLLWAWLPNQATGNSVGLDIGRMVELGPFDPATRGLFSVPIDAEQQPIIETSAPVDLFSAPLLSMAQADVGVRTAMRDITLPDYLHTAQPDLSVLRRVSWFASQRYEDFKRLGSNKWLATVKWDDLSSAPLPVERDIALFTTLEGCVEARRVVFLLGGYESGLTTFLEQFKNFLPKQQPINSHLTADFNQEYFENVLGQLERSRGLLKGLHLSHKPSTALFMSLAYSAYERIAEWPDTDQKKLNGYMRSETTVELEEFRQIPWSGTSERRQGPGMPG